MAQTTQSFCVLLLPNARRKRLRVYRFVACGSMEEAIYMRQVAKNALGSRVVDGGAEARHFTEQEPVPYALHLKAQPICSFGG